MTLRRTYKNPVISVGNWLSKVKQFVFFYHSLVHTFPSITMFSFSVQDTWRTFNERAVVAFAVWEYFVHGVLPNLLGALHHLFLNRLSSNIHCNPRSNSMLSICYTYNDEVIFFHLNNTEIVLFNIVLDFYSIWVLILLIY